MDAVTARSPEAFASANGLALCYDVFGDPAAPPLLLIMGLGAQMILWDDEFCAAMAERGYRVIRFDNRDVGRSTYMTEPMRIDLPALLLQRMQGKPIAAPYLVADMAADAVGLLDFLGIESAHIVGASMGGMIAQEMAIRFPVRVRSLVSIMSSTGAPNLPPPSPEGAAVLMGPTPTSREEFIAGFCRNWKVLRAGTFAEDEARDPARAARMWDRGTNPPGFARQMVAILASGDRTAPLAGVTAPTLVIHGTPDPLVPIEAGRATAAAIPGAKLLELESMGHALPVALWPEVIGAIAEHCK